MEFDVLNGQIMPVPASWRMGQLRCFMRRLRLWARDPDEQYLAEATDLADLERRMRALERASGGPAFVTFNH